MKKIFFAAVIVSISLAPAFAQTTPAATTNGSTPAVASPNANNPAAPIAGANSFTEGQAKDRIEKAGFTEVKVLKKDDNGIWMASGMKDGKAANIALDYQGNVVAK